MLTHSLCGHVVRDSVNGVSICSFCQCDCGADILRTFNVKITLADDTAKIFAWCTGQTAAELLQISPVEFYELPEVISWYLLSFAQLEVSEHMGHVFNFSK